MLCRATSLVNFVPGREKKKEREECVDASRFKQAETPENVDQDGKFWVVVILELIMRLQHFRKQFCGCFHQSPHCL